MEFKCELAKKTYKELMKDIKRFYRRSINQIDEEDIENQIKIEDAFLLRKANALETAANIQEMLTSSAIDLYYRHQVWEDKDYEICDD